MSAQPLMIDSLSPLTRDLRKAAETLSGREVHFLVDLYYQIQETRKGAANRVRSLPNQPGPAEPHELFAWLATNQMKLENNIRSALSVYTLADEVGLWSRSIIGIGPVIAAGLLAHIDVSKAPTAGNVWRFAGLDPTQEWGKGEKRPWNASLKTLCWKIGESFVKVSGHKDDIYGHIWRERKDLELARNDAGEFAEQAKAKLARYKIGKNTVAYYWYAGFFTPEEAQKRRESGSSQDTLPAAVMALNKQKISRTAYERAINELQQVGVPMLPPAHIHARAQRYAVKLFLSHWHAVACEVQLGVTAPLPWVIEHGGHAHLITPPNWNGVSQRG